MLQLCIFIFEPIGGLESNKQVLYELVILPCRNLSSSHMGNFLVHKRGYCYMDLQAPGRPCLQKLLSESLELFL